MTALLFLLGVVVFAVGLVASIALHECGHMVFGKAFGVKVTQYFVGFGKTVWSTRRGETEYGVKAIPLGGFVKLIGMLPPEPGRPADELRPATTGMFTQLITDARTAEAEHVGPGDEHRVFYRLAWWKKTIVMAAGPVTNLVIAFCLFWGLFATFGNVRDVALSTTIHDISQCVVPYAESGRACTTDDPVAPAYAAGLRDGDRVTSFNGTAITSWSQLSRLIRGNGDGEAVIGYERASADGWVEATATTHTLVASRPADTDPNSTETDPQLVEVGFLGIAPTQTLTKGGPLYTLGQMGAMTGDTVVALGQLPAKTYHVALAVIGVEKRDPNGPVSIIGGGRFAGDAVAEKGLSAGDKIAFLTSLLAGFNLFIGALNFVPLLPLDGGHILGALYEGLRRGVARLLRRPDPGFVDVAKAVPIAYVGGMVLLVMGGILILGDIVAPVGLPS